MCCFVHDLNAQSLILQFVRLMNFENKQQPPNQNETKNESNNKSKIELKGEQMRKE